MNNFIFQNPVKIIFGKGMIGEISNEIAKGSKVLIIYGGGSIKANGVYDQVVAALEGSEIYEFSGIEPNPHYGTCMKAVALIREKKIDFLLAVGGGSVIDATKFIAAASCYDGENAWDLVTKGKTVDTAVPFGAVLTLSATGSEMNNGAVITHEETLTKLAFFSDHTYPKFSVLDPTTTFSLPVRQVGNGVVDTFVHVIEQYLTYPLNTPLQDGFAETILKILLEEGPKALENPTDYDVRANLMWASTWALNGWIARGVAEDWATHMIGHEITALYGLDHAQTLAIVLPGIIEVARVDKEEKILQLGENVFGIYNNLSIKERVDLTIQAVVDFFEEMGVKTRLSDYKLGQEVAVAVADRFKSRNWKVGERQKISDKEVAQALMLRL